MKQVNIIGSILIFTWVLTGCGSVTVSSSESTSTDVASATVTAKTGTGTYVDSAVKGVSYVCGTQDGTTDEDGTFIYDVNSSCIFTLNGMSLRVVESRELNETTIKVFEDNTTIAQFLQSLDEDGNSSNGINISEEIQERLSENNIRTIPSSFSEVEEMVRVLSEDAEEDNSTFEYSGRAVPDDEVEEHLEETREELRVTDTTAPIITIIGDNPLSITQNSTYSEQGATATDAIDGTITVSTSGDVDTSMVGVYTITYTAADTSNNRATVTRTVTVTDETAPVLTLIGDNPLSIAHNTSYTELGATATDAVDGTINVSTSGSVDASTIGSYTITYTATDASNNTSTISRTVTVVDETAPVITITGENPLSISQNSTYIELGAIAIDAVDGTVSVSTSGSVDTSIVGSYSITYSATDTQNNIVTTTRIVNVITSSAVTVTDSSGEVIDITDKVLTNGSGNCADYVASYSSAVTDIENDTDFEGSLTIEVSNNECKFISNVIPNHDFNDDTAHFANAVEAQTDNVFSITTSPEFADSVTYLELGDNAIFLNGVQLSIRSAGCFGITESGTFQDGYEGVNGCNDNDEPFRFDPLGTSSKFGADAHNAHTQPGGVYHYHGSPLAMYDTTGATASAIIGFAGDGYPIFGSYISDNGSIRKATSSYILKSGSRTSVTYNGNTYNPGGSYDGTYVSDWEYSEGTGDLDECNGMTINGTYGYYAIESFPWVLNCFKGTSSTVINR